MSRVYTNIVTTVIKNNYANVEREITVIAVVWSDFFGRRKVDPERENMHQKRSTRYSCQAKSR